jgi:hypothetical protein
LILDFGDRDAALRAGISLSARFDFFGGPLLLPRSFPIADHPERPRLVLEISGREGLSEPALRRIIDHLHDGGMSPLEFWEEANRGSVYRSLRDFPEAPASGQLRYLREYRGERDALIGILPYLGSRWILDLGSGRLRAEEHIAEPMQVLSNIGGVLLDRRAEIIKRGVAGPSLYDALPGRAFLERVARSLDPSGRMAPGRWLLG